jgi:hypothetical protein
MTFRERLAKSVRRLRPEDLPALRSFQREMFGDGARQLDEERHSWLFGRNPYNDANEPQFWICEKDDRVVGQQAGIPFELKVGDRFYRASWAIDLMVQPEYRLRVVGPALNEACLRYNDLTIGLGLSDEAIRTFRRAGWIDLGKAPLYVRPLRAGAMLAHRPGTKLSVRAGAWVTQPLISAGTAAVAGYCRARHIKLERVERFDERVDELWVRVSRHYPVLAVRDFRSVSWRFDLQPDRSRYEKYYLLSHGALQGYVVLRMGSAHGAPAGRIVDFFAEPEWLVPLFAACVDRFRRSGVAAVYCCAFAAELRRIRWLGFIRRSSTVRLMVHAGAISMADVATLSEQASCFMTTADSDWDHGDPAEQHAQVQGK